MFFEDISSNDDGVISFDDSNAGKNYASNTKYINIDIEESNDNVENLILTIILVTFAKFC